MKQMQEVSGLEDEESLFSCGYLNPHGSKSQSLNQIKILSPSIPRGGVCERGSLDSGTIVKGETEDRAGSRS
ncbi:hypothetical protein HanPSC8_Chr06g0260731 [Helianthus annuus]|nr:hypothetical protein HanPSC8_Chr06g0260731 [Helianthus annuus]